MHTKEYHRDENVKHITKKRKVSILKEAKELELQNFLAKTLETTRDGMRKIMQGQGLNKHQGTERGEGGSK